MSATFGERLRVTVFGQSHSEAMGAVVDGLPAGLRIDTEHLRASVLRMRMHSGALSVPRTPIIRPTSASADTTISAAAASFPAV